MRFAPVRERPVADSAGFAAAGVAFGVRGDGLAVLAEAVEGLADENGLRDGRRRGPT